MFSYTTVIYTQLYVLTVNLQEINNARLTFVKDFINNESVCHFMVVQL